MQKSMIYHALRSVILGLLFTSTPAFSCTAKDPVLVVSIASVPFKLDTSLTHVDISAINQDKDTKTVGLTVVHYSAELQAEDEYLECQAQKITLELVPVKKVIYIGSEFIANRCVMDQIKEHEQAHVDVVNSFENSLEYRLGLRWSWLMAAKTPTQEAQTEILTYFKALLDQLTEDQRRLDSPAEYQKAGESCGGFLNKFLRN